MDDMILGRNKQESIELTMRLLHVDEATAHEMWMIHTGQSSGDVVYVESGRTEAVDESRPPPLEKRRRVLPTTA